MKSRSVLKMEFFFSVAEAASKLSTCTKRKVGACLVLDNKIISTGYNGAPSGMDHCLDAGCKREDSESGKDLNKCVAVHAEQNAIVTAARFGIATNGATLFCTTEPCGECYKIMKNAGISKVYFKTRYPQEEFSSDTKKEKEYFTKELSVNEKNLSVLDEYDYLPCDMLNKINEIINLLNKSKIGGK